MASDMKKPRVEKKLKVKVGEAKNLIPRTNSNINQKEIWCLICLDQEQIFKSVAVEKTSQPFFGEEFQFDIPREFRFISFYLYDKDGPMKNDKLLGKVSIKKSELKKYQGKDHWFPILPVDSDSEVQGQVHVEIKFKVCQNIGENSSQKIEVRIRECINLPIINSSCDPFATVTMFQANNKSDTRKTKAKKKTTNPTFNEVFVFEHPYETGNYDKENMYSLEDAAGFRELRVTLWHESSGMFGNVFLGEIRIPLVDAPLSDRLEAWYFLQPRESASKYLNKNELGALRLNMYYIEDTVFSSSYYEPFRNLILNLPDRQSLTACIPWLLGELIPNKQEIALPLTRLLYHHGKIVPVLSNLFRLEFESISDTNTMFRGNTLVSKCMDELMKLIGHQYLKDTLSNVITSILREKKPCEIDPTRLSPTDNRESNMANLVYNVRQIIEAITRSALMCPPVMCQVFSALREYACLFFPNKPEVRYSVISSFVFLRFFAPAILGPKLFGITSDQIEPSQIRTLTLLSKSVQNICNQACFRQNSSYTFKEPHMREVFEKCMEEAPINPVEGVRMYLEIVSQIPNVDLKSPEMFIILKEGVMVKRAQGRKKFGLKNFKTRFFRLTTQDFSYYKKKDGPPLCVIPLENILAVEKVEESSFKLKNMFQLVQHERTLYMQAPNCVEEKQWIDLLTKVLQFNTHRLKQYHPGAYINSFYQCCRATCESAPGCSAVSNYIDYDVKIQIDSDREVERIYNLINDRKDTLQKLYEKCMDYSSVSNSQQDCMFGDIIVTNPQATARSFSAINAKVSQLETEHLNYEKHLLRSTKYGSKQTPIESDNYLNLDSGLVYQGGHFSSSVQRTSSSLRRDKS